MRVMRGQIGEEPFTLAAPPGADGSREVELSAPVSARIRAAWEASNRARARAQEITDTALEALGLDLGKADDPICWNIVDGRAGRLVARYGPRMGVAPNIDALLAEAFTRSEPVADDETKAAE